MKPLILFPPGLRLYAAALLRALAVAALLIGSAPSPAAPIAASSESQLGERIFREGVLPDDSALLGRREGAATLTGKEAACVNCHRRSGMGGVEGSIVIAPITADALFHPGERQERLPEHAHHLATPPNRIAYTDETLARAIREGLSSDGRRLSYLMPRYTLDDGAMPALLAHLRQLSAQRTPGEVNDELHFATIVTPDADPAARDAMLGVLRAFFAQKNDFSHDDPAPLTPGSTQRRFRTPLRWVLHVWQLNGAPETWERQLDEHLHAEPVFAVISGLGRRTWAPVHAFCEHRSVPCLFPNVDLPVVAEGDFYPVYFSRGVLLEADLIAARLADPGSKATRLIQVFRRDDIGAEAAAALRQGLASTQLPVVDQVLPPDADAAALAKRVAESREGDALVLWLRPDDLAHLPAPPAAPAAVFLSGVMGELEAAPLPAPWRALARMPYLQALPAERRVMLNYPLGWMRARQIPVVNPRVQIDTYVACSILGDSLISTHGKFLRDFLVERIEETTGSRPLIGNFKRLGLAPGRRFASKGGYLVRFSEPGGGAIAADGDWLVP